MPTRGEPEALGAYVRNGLVDRRYNPRLASRVVGNLYALLNAAPAPWTPGGVVELPSGRICAVERPGELLALLLPAERLVVDRVAAGRTLDAASGTARRVDLATGEIDEVAWTRAGGVLVLTDAYACATPTALCFGP